MKSSKKGAGVLNPLKVTSSRVGELCNSWGGGGDATMVAHLSVCPSVTKSSSQQPEHKPLYLQYRVLFTTLVLTSCCASYSRNLYTVAFDMALCGGWIAATGLRAEME